MTSDKAFSNTTLACEETTVPDAHPTRSDWTPQLCPGLAASDVRPVARRRRLDLPPLSRTMIEEDSGACSNKGDVGGLDLQGALVHFIAEHGSAVKILAEHTATQDGRCPRCPAGASSSGRMKSPCTLFLAAQAAAKLGGTPPERR
jgi:hypothetical protein